MARPPVLYLAPDGLHCYRQHKRTTEHDGHFAPEPAGLEAFARWLGGFATGTPFMLLADLPDERFRIETLPHVRGSDRKHLRERRQAQIFPDTPYVAHQYLDREQSGRQDDRVLFVALNRPSAIAPWLAIIERNGHRLKRLVPAPFLATAITSGLPATSKPILLALRTPAGLRVSCIDKDKLLFSRLQPRPPHLPPSLDEWKTAAQDAYRHLLSQRFITHDTHCTCYLLISALDRSSPPPESLPDHDALHFILKDPTHLITNLSQPSPCEEDCLPLLLHLFTRHSQLPQATPTECLFANHLHQIGLTLQASAAAILLICVAFSIANMREIQALEQRSTTTKARGDATEHDLAALQAATPAAPHPLAQLQTALDALRHLNSTSSGPEPALHQLARALEPIPHLTLGRIDWSASSPPSPAKETSTPAQTLTLHFSLPREGSRERVSHAQHILAALGAIPGAHLSAERLPAEMTASRALSPAVIEANAQATDLVVRIDLPVTKP